MHRIQLRVVILYYIFLVNDSVLYIYYILHYILHSILQILHTGARDGGSVVDHIPHLCEAPGESLALIHI